LGVVLADRIASKLARGRVEKVADTGHFMPMEKPREIAQMAVEFLK
jgi:pimeloyl-ACP methyl ester carboxylesterase